jgi:uncharacterized protein YggE
MKYNSLLVVTGMLILAVFLTGCGAPALAQTLPTPAPQIRTLQVSGTGEVSLTPDIATINIGVHTEHEDAAEALASNNTQAHKVIDLLKGQGIAEKDIRTSNFSIYPQQQYDGQGNPTGIKFVVDNSVIVTVRDLGKIGTLLDAAVQAGANSISGISFDVADKTAALSEARKQAVADAKAQAAGLAEAAGVKLAAIQNLSVSSGYQSPVYGGFKAADMAGAAVPINPGQLTITVNVNIVYEIQ